MTPFRFLSLFSGIEAASTAWNPLGWQCVGVSEIERFPCEALSQCHPDAPNLGDMGDVASALTAQAGETGKGDAAPCVAVCVTAFQSSQSGVRISDVHATLDSNNGPRRHNGALIGMQVRRITPRECERLQGFPDDYTLVSSRGKPAADGPRYKALGNSMAVPVMAWIGRQIDFVMLFDVAPADDDLFA